MQYHRGRCSAVKIARNFLLLLLLLRIPQLQILFLGLLLRAVGLQFIIGNTKKKGLQNHAAIECCCRCCYSQTDSCCYCSCCNNKDAAFVECSRNCFNRNCEKVHLKLKVKEFLSFSLNSGNVNKTKMATRVQPRSQRVGTLVVSQVHSRENISKLIAIDFLLHF